MQRQHLHQREARQVLDALALMDHLTTLGQAEHVGSSASGLMVWRDLDVGARCAAPSAREVFRALEPIVTDASVHQVEYYRETGPRSPTGLPEDQRYYFVVRYTTPQATTGRSTSRSG